MSIATWLRTPRIRRGLAASAVLLAAGGLILFRAPAGASTFRTDSHVVPLGQGTNFAQFSGPGVHGQISLSYACGGSLTMCDSVTDSEISGCCALAGKVRKRE